MGPYLNTVTVIRTDLTITVIIQELDVTRYSIRLNLITIRVYIAINLSLRLEDT